MIVRVLFLLFISTVVNAQTGPCAVQTGPLKADLSIRISEARIVTQFFDPNNEVDACTVQEGDVSGFGEKGLLIFTTTTPNIGDANLYFGDPRNCPGLYELETCHGHPHLRKYATYRLWKDAAYFQWVKIRNLNIPITGTPNEAFLLKAEADGNLIQSRKQAFCIIDFLCYKGGCWTRNEFGIRTSTQNYPACFNQGLTAGWADAYPAGLPGQWVETASLVKGQKYVLEVHVNPDWIFQEKSYLNNVDAVKFVY